MSFTFRPAVRENVGLLIGLAGASGSGKTFTALRLAKGIAGDKPFAVIDTEARRALHYADQFKFDHADLRPPFNPLSYAEAIEAADKAGYPAIVIDSFTHEHAGVGGILDMQETEHKRLGGGDNMKMLSWVKPKGEHRRMVARLLQVRAHLILCFRAEEKVEMKRGADGKMEVVKKVTATGIDGWVPIAEKTLPYELTASFLLLPMKPGVPVPIKLQEQHKALFPLDQAITEESGKRLSEWARGGAASPPAPAPTGKPAVLADIKRELATLKTPAARQAVCKEVFGVASWADVEALPLATLQAAVTPAEGADISRLEGAVITAKEGAA